MAGITINPGECSASERAGLSVLEVLYVYIYTLSLTWQQQELKPMCRLVVGIEERSPLKTISNTT